MHDVYRWLMIVMDSLITILDHSGQMQINPKLERYICVMFAQQTIMYLGRSLLGCYILYVAISMVRPLETGVSSY